MNENIRRVVVTGLGAITPLGKNTEETWQALKSGTNGIAPITLFDTENYKAKLGAEVKGFKSEVAGDADIFIVPNIEAGNIMGKTLGDILGAKAAGVIVGTDTPIVMCSRADNDETKLCSIALGCLMAGLNK